MIASPVPPTPAASAVPRIPWWVTSLDTATIALLLVLVSNVAFNGFRLQLGPLRITADSPLRPLLIAIAAAGLRHWLWRVPTLPRRIMDWLARAWESPARPIVLPAFVLSRAMVAAIGFLGIVLIGYPKVDPPFRVSRNELVNLPVRWDAGWYLQIALEGYDFRRASRPREQQNIAFFPGYPLLARTTAALLGLRPARMDEPRGNEVEWRFGQHRRVVFGGLFVSLASFAWALVYLFRLAREMTDDDAAAGAVLMASAWPCAIFFNALYTEALFLLACVAAFYHLRRRELAATAAWGLLAGLSRPNGFLLAIPLGWLALQNAWSWRRTAGASEDSRAGARHPLLALTAAAMPVVGMALFSAFLYRETGRPLAWMEAHQAWGRVATDLNALLSDRMTFISDQGLYTYSVSQPIELLNAVPIAVALALAIPIARQLGPAYAILLVVMILPPLARGGFLSLGRLTSTLFPLFLYLGWLLRGSTRTAVVLACAGFQALLALLFFTWRPFY